MIGITNLKMNELFNIEKGSLQSSKNIEGNYNFITASTDWKTHETFTHDCEALVFAMGASGSLGRTHYVNDKFISSDLCFVLTPKPSYIGKVDLKFYYYFFNTFREDIVKKTATGTSKKAINLKNFSKLEIPYFGMEYQQIYKGKIESIEYYQQELNQVLTHNLRDIAMLKEQILHAAIEGKLVGQDENDEPASVLLERINVEKEKLIKEKKIKKEKTLSQITDEEKPFDLPDRWEWVRLGSIIHSINNGIYKPESFYSDNGVMSLRMYNIQNGCIIYENVRRMILTEEEKTTYKLMPGDILLNRVNSKELVGKAAIIEDFDEDVVYESMNMRLRFMESKVLPKYINKFLLTNMLRKELTGFAKKAIGQASINQEQIRNILAPIPPLHEQKRIVEKVDQLMILCDELEINIEQSKHEGEKLMKAVLQEAFTVKEEVLN